LQVFVGFVFDNNKRYFPIAKRMSLVGPPVITRFSKFDVNRWESSNITVHVSILVGN